MDILLLKNTKSIVWYLINICEKKIIWIIRWILIYIYIYIVHVYTSWGRPRITSFIIFANVVHCSTISIVLLFSYLEGTPCDLIFFIHYNETMKFPLVYNKKEIKRSSLDYYGFVKEDKFEHHLQAVKIIYLKLSSHWTTR